VAEISRTDAATWVVEALRFCTVCSWSRAVAAISEADERVVEEIADLWFHSYVLLAARGLDPAAVEDELLRRACS